MDEPNDKQNQPPHDDDQFDPDSPETDDLIPFLSEEPPEGSTTELTSSEISETSEIDKTDEANKTETEQPEKTPEALEQPDQAESAESAEAAEPEEPPDPLTELAQSLKSAETETRLETIKALGELDQTNLDLVRKLEWLALHDPAETVQQAAMTLLQTPVYRDQQKRRTSHSRYLRQTIAQEIDNWVGEGLLPAMLAPVLKLRYEFDRVLAQPGEAKKLAPAEPRPQRSLSEILLSETTIRIALFLGAVFIICAASIFAIAIEVLRLPILFTATIIFLGAGIGLKRRLPLVSFSFAIIFSFLIGIDAWVLQMQVAFLEDISEIYWAAVSFLLVLVWIGGTMFYRSRIFSVLTLAAALSAAFLLGLSINDNFYLAFALMGLANLIALGGVYLLKRWQDATFARPLFWAAQLVQISLLGGTLINLSLEVLDQNSLDWWGLALTLTWGLAVLFYLFSQVLVPLVLFPILATLALLPLPFFLISTIDPGPVVLWSVGWIWGIVLALTGMLLRQIKIPVQWSWGNLWNLALFGLYFLIASAPIFILAIGFILFESVILGVVYLLGVALVYGALMIYQRSIWLWLGALLAFFLAYLAVYALPPLIEIDFHPGYIFFWPALFFLSMHLVFRRWLKTDQVWWLPPLVWGGVAALASLLLPIALLLDTTTSRVIASAILYFLWAGYAMAFGLLDRQPRITYGGAASLVLALFFFLLTFETETPAWVLPFVILAVAYYLAGMGLHLVDRFKSWAKVWLNSGLVLGALVGFSAPAQAIFNNDLGSIFGPATIAVLFTVEAFRRRNVWFGVPANLLYLISYMLVLFRLEVSQPQFYSIGAALMGLIMHYFLVRSGSQVAAFIAGTVSQLVLLGTTYIQMFATDGLIFFIVLFFQSLAVLAYGLVIRSRSLVLAPIAFVILGVITVAFTALAGIPTLILIGCSGFILIGLAILALLMREQLLKATSDLGDRFGDWRA